ncbi:hypothetical protein [Streptomyces sp. NPDC055099]
MSGSEAAAVVKASADIIQGVKALKPADKGWPNAREGLMELFVILEDWCSDAESTEAYALLMLHARENGHDFQRQPIPPRWPVRPAAGAWGTSSVR